MKTIISYFSAQGTTKKIAENVAKGCVVNTFCKGYDFSGKKVAAFATSGASPIGKTAEKLSEYVKGASEVTATLIHNEDELKALL